MAGMQLKRNVCHVSLMSGLLESFFEVLEGF